MTIAGFINQLRGILDSIVPFIIGLAVFVIVYEVFTYIRHAANEEKRTEARLYIVYSIIGVFFMLSIWGFVNILYNSFTLERQIDAGKIPHVPSIQTDNNSSWTPNTDYTPKYPESDWSPN